jgi:hydrogenase maturation protease
MPGMTVLIVGYGNPLRGDDGLGPAIARAAAEMLGDRVAARVVECHQLTPELAEDLAAVSRAIFADASVDAAPGEVSAVRVTPDASAAGSFSHHVTPATLLTCARILYGRAPEAWLVSAGVASCESGEGLTPAAAAAVPLAARRVVELALAAPGAAE